MKMTIRELHYEVKDEVDISEVEDVSEIDEIIREKVSYKVNTGGYDIGFITSVDSINEYKHLLDDPSNPEDILEKLTYKVLLDELRKELSKEIEALNNEFE